MDGTVMAVYEAFHTRVSLLHIDLGVYAHLFLPFSEISVTGEFRILDLKRRKLDSGTLDLNFCTHLRSGT